MYANQYDSHQPSLSNNPFVEDPSTAHARFPDLAASGFQPGYPSNGYPNQPQQFQQQYQQYPSQAYVQGTQYQATQPQVMPQTQFTSSSFASPYPAQGQIGPQPTSMGTFQQQGGFAQQPPQQYPIQTGYPYSGGNFQANSPPNYLSEFDPYAYQAQQNPSQSQSQTGQNSGTGPTGVSHPRDLIRTHKTGLEAWDSYSWKQLFNACDALKDAWATRKHQAEGIVQQYGGPDPGLFGPDPAFGYNSQVEGWKQVLKDANNNFDTIAASAFQLHEVYNSYRQSGDRLSKQRVRESCNAAMKNLPDWPSN